MSHTMILVCPNCGRKGQHHVHETDPTMYYSNILIEALGADKRIPRGIYREQTRICNSCLRYFTTYVIPQKAVTALENMITRLKTRQQEHIRLIDDQVDLLKEKDKKIKTLRSQLITARLSSTKKGVQTEFNFQETIINNTSFTPDFNKMEQRAKIFNNLYRQDDTHIVADTILSLKS